MKKLFETCVDDFDIFNKKFNELAKFIGDNAEKYFSTLDPKYYVLQYIKSFSNPYFLANHAYLCDHNLWSDRVTPLKDY